MPLLMQPNLRRNLCFLPTKNTKYRTFYRTHFLLISITCLSRYISLSFYRPALIYIYRYIHIIFIILSHQSCQLFLFALIFKHLFMMHFCNLQYVYKTLKMPAHWCIYKLMFYIYLMKYLFYISEYKAMLIKLLIYHINIYFIHICVCMYVYIRDGHFKQM